MRLYYDSTPTEEDPTWVRVSAIVEFPDIISRLNTYGLCTVVLRDFEGALYATWYSRDFTRMKVTDDAGTPNTIFRGYLRNKKFHDRDLILEIVGIGELLERKSFGREEEINYILGEGKVDTTNASSIIDVYNDLNNDFIVDVPEEEFSWDADYWSSDDKDVGLFIVDNTTDYDSRSWDSSAIALSGDNGDGGNNASTIIYADSDILWAKDTTLNVCDLIITPTIDGAVIDDNNSLKSIEVQYSFKLKVSTGAAFSYATVYLQILKDTTWITIDSKYLRCVSSTVPNVSNWITAIPAGNVGSTKIPWLTEDTDTELQKFFNTDGAGDYDELKGMRFKLVGKLTTGGAATVYIDYIKVITKYHTYDVSPIINRITDNTATTLTCSDVSNFQELGITDSNGTIGDAFQIGQNIRTIIDDISSESGLDIVIIPESEKIEILRPNGDILKQWLGPTVGSAHLKINDDVEQPDTGDLDPMYTGGADAGESNIIAFGTITDAYLIKEITVWIYGKEDVGTNNMSVDINLGGWVGAQNNNLLPTYSWTSVTFSDLSGSKLELDGLQVKFTAANNIDATHKHYVDVAYCEVSYISNNWSKYMARKFKGKHCSDVLKAVCRLEGAYWIEDYIYNRILLIKKDDFVDSGVNLTQTDYDHDWEYEDQCNQVKSVYVWGKSSYNKTSKTTTNIFAKAIDEDIEGDRSIQIIDDTISNQTEAQELADKQLDLFKDKRPSIRIPLNGINSDLQLGTTVGLTMVRPTVAEEDYPIRMIERSRFGKTDIKTVIYCGRGETKWDEKFFKTIRHLQSEIHRLSSENLTSTPYETGSSGITWNSIIGSTAGVENIITAELVGGQSIDNRIDALLTANADGFQTQANVETIITAELVNGQSIDNAIDALILTHKGDASAHHSKYTDAEATTQADNKITAECVNGQTIDNAIDALILTHKNIADAHQSKYTNAEAVAAVLADDGYLKNNAADTTTGDLTVPNLICAGLVDGKDVSGLCTTAEAKTHIEANTKIDDLQTGDDNVDLNASTTEHGLLKKLDNNALSFMNGQGNWAEPAGAGGISEADVFAYLAIGIGNKRWKNCILEGGNLQTSFKIPWCVSNLGATDYSLTYTIPLPYIENGKNLVITQIKVGVYDADVNNYVDHVYVYCTTGINLTTPYDDGTNRTAQGNYTYNPADITLGGNYEKVWINLKIFATTVNMGDFSMVKIEYYYA